MSKTNRFSDLLNTARSNEESGEEINTTESSNGLKEKAKEKTGKNSNPEYVQISAYIKKETRLKARKLLVDSDEDLSDVIEKLLSEWIESGM
jgi:hypothetical protein